jgi:hypothetical protein
MSRNLSKARTRAIINELFARNRLAVVAYKDQDDTLEVLSKPNTPFYPTIGLVTQAQTDIARQIVGEETTPRSRLHEGEERKCGEALEFESTEYLVDDLLEGLPAVLIVLKKSGMTNESSWTGSAWSGPVIECLGLAALAAHYINDKENQRRREKRIDNEFEESIVPDELDNVELAVLAILGEESGLKITTYGEAADCAGLAEQARERILSKDPPQSFADGFVAID